MQNKVRNKNFSTYFCIKDNLASLYLLNSCKALFNSNSIVLFFVITSILGIVSQAFEPITTITG